MGNATRLAFEANIEHFLRDHALIARAGWASGTKSGVGDVRAPGGHATGTAAGRRATVRSGLLVVHCRFISGAVRQPR